MENLYRLEIESLDLGPNVRAVGLELIDRETREPVKGNEAAAIWAALLPALVGEQPWAIDFFAHLERVREFCRRTAIAFREPNLHSIVIPQPEGRSFSRCSSVLRTKLSAFAQAPRCAMATPRSKTPWPNAG